MRSYRWEIGFPAVYWHTSVSFLLKCPGFRSARCGNFQAARDLVDGCIKQRRIEKLRQMYPDAVLLPIMTNNKLPIALAQAIGLEVCTSASVRFGGQGKPMSTIERLLCQQEFANVQPRRYILVDDIVARGGTMEALRNHVVRCGGSVAAVVALACSFGDEEMMQKNERVRLLNDQSGGAQKRTVLREFCVADLPFETLICQGAQFAQHHDMDQLIQKAQDAIRYGKGMLSEKAG